MTNTNNIAARDVFERARKMFFDAWLPSFKGDANRCWAYVNGLKLSQSEIRLEVGLNTTNTVFQFGMTPNQANSDNTVYKSENRLQMQDSLVTSEYGFYLMKPSTAGGTDSRLYTYGNPEVFTTGFNALDSTLYANGKHALRVNNDVVIPYRGMFNHYYRPQTQQVAALAAGAVGDQLRGAEDGSVTQEPNLLLIGSKNYVPTVELPAALAAVDANTRLVLIYRGILAQNSTVIN